MDDTLTMEELAGRAESYRVRAETAEAALRHGVDYSAHEAEVAHFQRRVAELEGELAAARVQQRGWADTLTAGGVDQVTLSEVVSVVLVPPRTDTTLPEGATRVYHELDTTLPLVITREPPRD